MPHPPGPPEPPGGESATSHVKLRYFAGLTIEEAAEVLGVSTPTAKRDWTCARAWMSRQIIEGGDAHEVRDDGI